jgi:hypothetical protein
MLEAAGEKKKQMEEGARGIPGNNQECSLLSVVS